MYIKNLDNPREDQMSTLDLFSKVPEVKPRSGMENALFYHQHTFTQGSFIMAATEDGLCALGFPTSSPDLFFRNLKVRFPNNQLVKSPDPFRDVIDQLEAYFSGQLKTFDLQLELVGTDFQLEVWRYLNTIPYGSVETYKQVASALDANPRTVGRAIGDNPVPIVIPCHRVIGAKGQMVGYAGGISMKTWLLQHENAIIL